jgi:hypothetical protein
MGSLEKRVAEATGGAERGEEEPERAEPRPDEPAPQESSQRAWRSLWRRLIGG